jgi:hypothetical protein
MSQTIPPRLRELIDDQVVTFVQSAQRHHKTDDLVILLDLSETNAELQAIPRQRMVGSSEVPERIRQKLSVPASKAAQVLVAPGLSFWFFVIYQDGDADCVAINASMLAPGGSA